MMTLQKIASEIAKREGKKSQTKIGDIREALRVLVDWDAEIDPDDNGPLDVLCMLSADRWWKRKQREAKKAAKAKR